MSREIKFRGYIEKIDDIGIDVPHEGHFVYGDLVHGDNFDCIVGGLIEATEEYAAIEWWQTIQQGAAEQFTGLKDANGDDIYENDIIKVSDETGSSFVSVVKYFDYDDYPAFDLDPQYIPTDWYFETNILSILKADGTEIKVVGNVHTSLELLEVDK